MTTTHQPADYATPGGVRQNGGTLPIARCARCNAEVVWVTSRTSGKRYPANVYKGSKGQRFYQGNAPHPFNCLDLRAASAAEFAAAETQAQVARTRTELIAAFQAARKANPENLDALLAQFEADMDALG